MFVVLCLMSFIVIRCPRVSSRYHYNVKGASLCVCSVYGVFVVRLKGAYQMLSESTSLVDLRIESVVLIRVRLRGRVRLSHLSCARDSCSTSTHIHNSGN
jgi:hypothetical protein